MKKLFVLAGVVLMTMFNAQAVTKPALAKDGFSVGLNSTGFGFSTVRDSGVRNTNVGFEAGWFVVDKLQAVGGLGYENTHVKNVGTVDEKLTYLGGFKYYVENVFPVQLDFNGDSKGNEYVGTQVGYAWFPSSNFSVEPRLRYDFATERGNKDVFSAGLGFNYFFK